jgi:hypothetical protein
MGCVPSSRSGALKNKYKIHRQVFDGIDGNGKLNGKTELYAIGRKNGFSSSYLQFSSALKINYEIYPSMSSVHNWY